MSKRRPSGDGLIRKRSDGRWEGRIVVGHRADGYPIYRSVFAKTQRELMPKLNQLKEYYAGMSLTEHSKITLGEWLDRWLTEIKEPMLRGSTMEGYRGYADNHIKPYIGKKTLTSVTTTDIQRLYNKLKREGRLRKDGRWEGRIVVGYDDRGLPKTKSVLAKTKTECVERLEALKEEIGATEVTRCTADMPFGEWMDFWYQTYCKPALKEYTQTTYEQRIYNQIIPKIGDVPLNQVTTGTLEKFYAHLKSDGRLVRREQYGAGLKNSVIRSIHAHCRAAFEKAKKENLIRQNPAAHCALPPKKSPEIEVLTPAEMQRLLIQAKYEADGFYEMFLLDLSTGLRRGELLGLLWEDINFETGELKVTKQVKFVEGKLQIKPPKTKAAERTIILPPQLITVLKEYKSRVRSKWLFPSPYKHEDVPRDPCSCRKKLATILERAECKHVPFHALRHTFATQALRYGMDVKTLASTIGHESVETTLNVYSHTTDEGMRTAANRIDRAMGAISGVTDQNNGVQGTVEQTPDTRPQKPPREKFEPRRGKYRRQGTGSIHQVSKNVWEGRYSPNINGKRIIRNVYASSIEECEQKLVELIATMNAEIAEMKQTINA